MQNNIFTDAIAQEDSLGRSAFAREIANNVVNHLPNDSESLVIGLSGKWGSGKSSLLNFIKKEITAINTEQGVPNAILFDFNPWMFSSQEELQFSFLSELISKLGDGFGDLANTIAELLQKFEFTKYLLPSSIKDGFEKVQEVITGFAKKRPVTDIKKEVDDLLVKTGIKLYIFIDDIDRLTPPETAEVFKLIKLNANFKNTVFFVAYDKEVVEHALRDTFGQHGEKYLEKIVQVDYSIPEILDEKIEEVFFAELKNIFDRIGIDADYKTLSLIWSLHGLKYYFSTLRSIYRYMNAINFRLSAIYKDINLYHFLIIEAIRVFDYDIYTQLYRAYLPWSKSFRSQFKNNDKSFQDQLEDTNAKSLIKYLLEDSKNKNNSDNAIFDSQYFERYFALSIATKDVSEQDFESFLECVLDQNLFLTHTYNANKLKNFFEKLHSPLLSKKYKIQNHVIIKNIIDFLDTHPEIFSSHGHLVFDSLINLVSSYEEKQEAFIYFLDNVRFRSSPMSYSRLYFLWMIREDILSDFKGSSLKEYKKLILQRQESINESLATFVKDWQVNFLSKPSESPYSYLLHMFLISMADFHSEELKKRWEILFDFPEELAILSKYFQLFDSDGNPGRIIFNLNEEIRIFPGDSKYRFVEAVKKADLDLVSAKNKKYLSFMKECFEEIDNLTKKKIQPKE